MNLFDELFTLELANNHWGSLERGLNIIRQYGEVVRANGVKAAIKLQYRDVDNFIHKDFLQAESRYIQKTLSTKMSVEDYATMVRAIKTEGCLAMCTPFDEVSVGWCVDTGIDIMKVASSDVTNYFLMEAIAATRKPVIFSTGATTTEEIDSLVKFFDDRSIPVGINHCVSIYPSEDNELEINQVEYLKNRYPGHTIGFSSHEYHSWGASMYLAYAKGARMFERHIDIQADDIAVPKYNSLPHQIDSWFKSFHTAKKMLGGPATVKHESLDKEVNYVQGLLRGIYASRDLPADTTLAREDFYLAIPVQDKQRTFKGFKVGARLLKDKKKDEPINEGDV